jgi:hypothetical protein
LGWKNENIYIKSLPSLWDQRWERRSWRPEQTQCRSKNKDIEVGRQNLMVVKTRMWCEQTNMLKI